MKQFIGSWQLWALLSATFAALTAIFAKIGIENVSSDFATFIRTVVIICALRRSSPQPINGSLLARFPAEVICF